MKKNMALIVLFFAAAAFLIFAAWMQGGSSEDVEIKVIDVQPFAYCCIPHKGPYTEIEPVIMQIFPALNQQGISPMGDMLGVYYNAPGEVSDSELRWEIGFPVSDEVTPNEPLVKKVWKHERVAAAIHTGPFEETGQTIEVMMKWIQEKGYKAAGPVLEKYLDMPGPGVDPSTLRTEVWIPVK